MLTGVTGFLGSALAKHWVQFGHSLTVLVRPESSMRRIERFMANMQVYEYKSDSDIVGLVQNISPDVIVHTACAYGRLGETPSEVLDVNVRLGMLLLDGVLSKAAPHVSFINTGTVLDPMVSAYAMSKYQFSQWGDLLAQQNPKRLQFINICLQHMYGPGDDPHKFVANVLHACQNNLSHLALTSGEQCRDFIYIDDVVSAYDVIVSRLNHFSASDQIDIGTGEAPSVRSLVEQVHTMMNSHTVLQFGAIPYRANEAMMYRADTCRLQKLGWFPTYTLEQGIQRMFELNCEEVNSRIQNSLDSTQHD